jgi:2-polyprenyl-3-methyl-5-hydroxy-6-metoxy-1,4-benzoquinol methylase
MTDATRPATDWLSRVRAVWNGRAQEWDQMAEVNALAEDRTAEIARLAVALDLHHGSTLLDAGCGTGQWAIAFATLGCKVTAQDLAPAMVDRAQAHARDRGVSISFRAADISSLPDANNAYDAIHARAVLLFVPDPPAVLREFRRVLKPGGRIFVSVPGALSPIYNRSWRRFVEPGNVGSTFMLPWELQALLEIGGWRVLEQWGNFGQNLMGAQNDLAAAVQGAPIALQQAAATIWGFVAE